MTTSAIDHRLLICSLCDRTFANPKLLPCLHVFCTQCLERYVQDVKDKRESEIHHVLDLTVLPEQTQFSPKPAGTVTPSLAAHQQSVDSKDSGSPIRSRTSTLDTEIPPQSYDDIPAHDATAGFHRRGADKDHHDAGIYEEVSARAPEMHATPQLRTPALKGVRSESVPALRESFAPPYIAMNKSQSSIDSGDLVAAALAGNFSDISAAALSNSREALNPPLDTSSDRSDHQDYTPPSPEHSFPDVVPTPSGKASDIQSKTTANLQRNNTICGKASLMPGFMDTVRPRRGSKGDLLDQAADMSKQPSMMSVISGASSSSGHSPGEDTTMTVATPVVLPKKVKDKTKNKRKSGDKVGKKTKKENKRKYRSAPPMMKPVTKPRQQLHSIPMPEVSETAECYHADVSHEDDLLYEMPVHSKRPQNSPPLPPRRGVPNFYTDSDTMRRSNQEALAAMPNVNTETLTSKNVSLNSTANEEDHYDFVDKPDPLRHQPSKKLASALLRDGTSHYGPVIRKSQTLLDGDGYEYINDAFEKLKIKTEHGESEFVYKEVHKLEEAISEEKPELIRMESQFSTSSNDSLMENEYECPQCSSLFRLSKRGVKGLKDAPFIVFLQDIHFRQCLKPKTCISCGASKIENECSKCQVSLCQNCNSKHQCSDIATQKSEHIYSNTNAKCKNHADNICEYYCQTCCTQVCNECYLTSHRHHACALVEVVKSRTDEYLGDFKELAADIKQIYEHEILQMDKYLRQYECDKDKVLSDITYAYVRARQLMEEAYCELSRHVNFRYEEEINHVKDLQAANKRFTDRIEYACCLAQHLTTHGNKIDNIEITKALSENLLDLQSHQPIKLETKLNVLFSPSTCKPIDFIPVIGNASRVYNSIRRRSLFPDEITSRRERLLHAKNPFIEVGLFKPRTEGDSRGCKPTGVTVSNKGEVVIVDDINRKIKVFSEKGELVHEINPKGEKALIDPWDITMTHYGNFVVTDKGSKSVKIFDTDGEIVSEFGKHLSSPWGVCANSCGDLIVTDTSHKSVFVHDSIGNLKYEVKGPERLLNFPEYVASNNNNDIIVSDFKGNCIHVFSSVGQFLFRIKPSVPNGSLFESPCGVTCDQEGNILLADFENFRVCEFTSGGQFKSYILTKSDHIRGPQCLATNRKATNQTPKLVLVDGTDIKIYRRRNSANIHDQIFEEGEDALDLELRPKSYNRNKEIAKKIPEAPRPRRKLLPLSVPNQVDGINNSQCLHHAQRSVIKPLIDKDQNSRESITSPDTYDIPKFPINAPETENLGQGHGYLQEIQACSDTQSIQISEKSSPLDFSEISHDKEKSKDSSPNSSTPTTPELPIPKPRRLSKNIKKPGLTTDLPNNTPLKTTEAEETGLDTKTVDVDSKSDNKADISNHAQDFMRKFGAQTTNSESSLMQENYRMSAINRSTRNKPLIDQLIKQLGINESFESSESSPESSAIEHRQSCRFRSGSAAGRRALKIPDRFKEFTANTPNKRRSVSLTRNAHVVSGRRKLNVSSKDDSAKSHNNYSKDLFVETKETNDAAAESS